MKRSISSILVFTLFTLLAFNFSPLLAKDIKKKPSSVQPTPSKCGPSKCGFSQPANSSVKKKANKGTNEQRVRLTKCGANGTEGK